MNIVGKHRVIGASLENSGVRRHEDPANQRTSQSPTKIGIEISRKVVR